MFYTQFFITSKSICNVSWLFIISPCPCKHMF